jgi:hypothetical protein
MYCLVISVADSVWTVSIVECDCPQCGVSNNHTLLVSAAVKLVLEAVCILKNVKPIRMKDTQSGQMVDSYWAASQKMLVDEDFLPSLR